MKRKIPKTGMGPEPTKKSKAGEDLALNDSVRGNFNVKLFRKKLNENDFISDYYQFLQEAKANSKVVTDYVTAGGQPYEIVLSLEKIDTNSIAHISCILQVLQLVLIEIITNSTQQTENAVTGCGFLLKKRRQAIEILLQSTVDKYKKSGLKILTAIVALDSRLAYEVLKLFNSTIKSDYQLQHLVKMGGGGGGGAKDDDDDREPVRTCFIHFIMAFLIEGNNSLIQNIVAKQELIQSLLRELHLDTGENIILVLGSLKNFLLKNLSVTKTKKMQIFDVRITENIFKIYKSFESRENCDQELAKTVRTSVHDFLTLLLSSYKFGIALKCIGQKQSKYNGIPREILRCIKQPWADDQLNHLASQILKACPELCEMYLGTFKRALETNNEELYVNILSFVQHVTTLLTPKSVLPVDILPTMSSKEVYKIVQSICLHPELMERIKDKGLKHSSYLVRLVTSNHLRVQIKSLGEYFNYLATFPGIRNVKLQAFGYIFQHYPPVDAIINMLYQTINDKSIPADDVLMHLECVIDILLEIVDINPSFIEKTSNVVNYLQILKPIYNNNAIDVDRRSIIEQKTIKLMLLLDPQALSTDSEIFQQLIGSLLNIYVNGTEDAKRAAKITLRDILLKTSLFESGLGEIDIWLMAFKSVDPKHVDAVKQFFAKTLIAAKGATENMQVDGEAQEESVSENIQNILRNIEKGDSVDGSFDVPIISTMLRHSMTTGKQMNQVDKYLDEVVHRLIHFHPNGQLTAFGRLFKKRKLLVENYLLAWFKEGSITIPDSFRYPVTAKIFENISKGVYSPIEDLETIDSSDLILHIHEILFFVNQLVRIKKCKTENVEVAKEFLINILKSIQNKDQEHPELMDLQLVLKYILQSQVELFKNWKISAGKKEVNLTLLIVEVIQFTQESLTKLESEQMTLNYRRKMLQLLETVGDKITENELKTLAIFDFSHEERTQVLDILRALEKPIDISVSAEIVTNIVAKQQDSVAVRSPMSLENVKFIERIFIEFISVKESDENLVDTCCDNFLTFLQYFPNHLKDVSFNIIDVLYSGERQTKSIRKLLVFLVRKLFKSNESAFLALLKKNYQKKEITYPLLNAIVGGDIALEKDLQTLLYQEYKSGIIKSIEKPQKAGLIYKECPLASAFLLTKSMPLKECQEFCRKVVKSDAVENFQVDLLKALHEKAISGSAEGEQKDQFVQNFVANLINFLHIQFKKSDTLSVEKILSTLVDWLKTHRDNKRNWEQLCENANWSQLVKNCLKLGMNPKVEGMETQPTDLLLLLGFLIEEFYPQGEYPDISDYYEMALTHSQFFNIMLGKDLFAKYPLARVLYVMATRAEKRVFLKQHVPILLGAYSAKLNSCDRILLALIHLYERSGTCLSEFQPFLWGEAAVGHYSLMGMESFDMVKTLEATSADQVFSLIDPEVMKFSLSNYPIWRTLNPLGNIETIEIIHEDDSYTKLERLVEAKQEDSLTGLDQKIMNRKEKVFDNCYDPAFFIPLMSMAFCPDFNSSPGVAAQNGMLALALEALSSYDPSMRRAAGLALVRYRRQMQSKKAFLDLELWNQFFLGISKGLQSITQKNEEGPRMSHISALFLGKLSIILTQPLIKMYLPLSSYISGNDSFDLTLVPHFQQLFLSPDVDHHSYREFILEVIQDGIKCIEDFDILDMGGILESLLAFFSCPFANIDTNLRILNVVNVIARIPTANKVLIEKYSLFAWLSGIIANLEPFFFDTVEALVHLLWNIYYSVQAARKEYNNADEVQMKIFYLLRKLVKVIVVGHSKLKTGYKLKVYEKIVRLLRRTAADDSLALRSIGAQELADWIDMGRTHFTAGAGNAAESATTRVVNELLYLKENLRMEFIESDAEFRERLSLHDNDVHSKIILELRRLVIGWTNCKQM